MGYVTEGNVYEVFSHHAPSANQTDKIEAIRAGAIEFARVIFKNAPSSADQGAAIRLVREAMMTANAAVILQGLI